MTEALVIAIDGPAGSGKSTLGRALAANLGLSTLDTGASYRAIAALMIRQGIDPDDRCSPVPLLNVVVPAPTRERSGRA